MLLVSVTKITPPEKKTLGEIGLNSTTSEAAGQFLLRDCSAEAFMTIVYFHKHRRQQSPAGQRKRGKGFEEPPCILEPLFFCARRGSVNPGCDLRTLASFLEPCLLAY